MTQTVADVMTRNPVATEQGESAAEAARPMARGDSVRRLPVLQQGHAVGVVSLGDLAMERDQDSALADISAARGNT